MRATGESHDNVHLSRVKDRCVAADDLDLGPRCQARMRARRKTIVGFDRIDAASLSYERGNDSRVVPRSSTDLENALARFQVQLIEEVGPQRRRSIVDAFTGIETDQDIMIEPARVLVRRAIALHVRPDE